MRDQPSGLPDDVLGRALRQHWGIEVLSLEYARVGAGSYHWHAEDATGRRWFVTADDLPNVLVFGGDDPDANYAGLRAAYETAAALRAQGLDFVLGPVAGTQGQVIERPLQDWTVAVFPLVAGESGRGGAWAHPALRAQAAGLVGCLHATTPPAAIPRWPPGIPHRAVIDAALADLGHPCASGPYAEPARDLLQAHQGPLRAMLQEDDRAVAELMASEEAWVVSHGEPHSGNFLSAGDGLFLIDWDTVRLAPRERDLWLVAGNDPEALAAYQRSAGPHSPRAEAMRFFETRWTLTDICFYMRRLRAQHTGTQDDARALDVLSRYLRTCLDRPLSAGP